MQSTKHSLIYKSRLIILKGRDLLDTSKKCQMSNIKCQMSNENLRHWTLDILLKGGELLCVTTVGAGCRMMTWDREMLVRIQMANPSPIKHLKKRPSHKG